jgi:hypothetical protein
MWRKNIKRDEKKGVKREMIKKEAKEGYKSKFEIKEYRYICKEAKNQA